jgi:endonuclease/exonuclease/phosphatase family metal-dependent hydrolase
MTFNIRHGRALDLENRWYRRRHLVLDAISTFGPHVLGAQEVDPFQLDELTDAFPGYAAIALRRYGGPRGAYCPIFFDTSRLEPAQSGDFWLSPDPDGDRTRAWDAAVARICTWAVFRERAGGARFAVFNTHLDQRGVEARTRSAELIAFRLNTLAHLPRLATMDLNANESSEPLAILKDAGLRDTYRDIHAVDEHPPFTFHAWRGTRSKGRLGKIDYVLADARFTTSGAAIVREGAEGRGAENRWPSDHFPVTATVSLRL